MKPSQEANMVVRQSKMSPRAPLRKINRLQAEFSFVRSLTVKTFTKQILICYLALGKKSYEKSEKKVKKYTSKKK